MLRAFLENLHQRGLRGVEFIVSDDHSGLHNALTKITNRHPASKINELLPWASNQTS